MFLSTLKRYENFTVLKAFSISKERKAVGFLRSLLCLKRFNVFKVLSARSLWGIKPTWSVCIYCEIKVFILLTKIDVNIFMSWFNNEIDLYDLGLVKSPPFLGMTTVVACFHDVGIVPESKM